MSTEEKLNEESIEEKVNRMGWQVKHLTEAVNVICRQIAEIKAVDEEIKEDPDLNKKSDGLEDARQLLNYAAKQLEKFNLAIVEISMTVEDIKYEIKVTK